MIRGIRVLVIALSLTDGFSAHALMQIDCVEKGTQVQLNALSGGGFSLNFKGLSLPVQFDSISPQARDLYSTSSISTAQDNYSSALVFSVPHGAISRQPGE